jgi:hypothetical protein
MNNQAKYKQTGKKKTTQDGINKKGKNLFFKKVLSFFSQEHHKFSGMMNCIPMMRALWPTT